MCIEAGPSACFDRVLGKHLDALSGLPNYDFIELAPLIDSANLLPTHWVNMAQELTDANTELLQALERAIRRGIVVVNTTQCAHGPVIQGAYATSSALERIIGVISASDMTLEAAFAKLHILLGLYKDSKVVSEKFALNWCGEMT